MIRVEPVDIDTIFACRAEVLRSGRPVSEVGFDGDTDPATLHLAAIDDGEVAGCLTVMAIPMPGDADYTHQLRGMAVRPAWRGQGVGAKLLAALSTARPGVRLWCNARQSAIGFYESQGWTQRGAFFDIPHHGPHVRMVAPPAPLDHSH